MTGTILDSNQAFLQHIKRQLNIHVKASGLSQSEIARRLEIGRPTVTNWLRTGQISKPNLVKLCQLLNISEQDILSADLRDFDKSPIELTDLQKRVLRKVQNLPKEQHYVLESIEKILS